MKLSADFVPYEIDNEKYLVCLDAAKFSGIIKLNGTGDFLVKLLKDEVSEEELAEKLSEEYPDAGIERCRDDVHKFIEALKETGALE